MTHNDNDAVRALDLLLEEERELLLAGEIDRIEEVLNAKETLIETLSSIDRNEVQGLETLQAKLMRNQSLLDGALQGIRRTSARLATLRKVRRTLETYTESGRKQTIDAQVTRKLERRA